MNTYPKIDTVFKRDAANNFRTLIEGDWSQEAFGYLANNQWAFTEKVDGTNIRVMIANGRVTFGGKTDNAQIPAFLVRKLEERFLPQQDALLAQFPDGGCLYGEGYGAKIQKGGGNYRSDQDFVLFDVLVRSKCELHPATLSGPTIPRASASPATTRSESHPHGSAPKHITLLGDAETPQRAAISTFEANLESTLPNTLSSSKPSEASALSAASERGAQGVEGCGVSSAAPAMLPSTKPTAPLDGLRLPKCTCQDWWLERRNVEDVAAKLGLDVVPVIGEGTLPEMIERVRRGFPSHWGPFTAEGIVARPAVELKTRNGERIITKLKHKDFEVSRVSQ